MTGEREHDPPDDRDTIFDALAVRAGPWYLRDGDTGEMIPVTREQLAQLLADRHRLSERDNPGE